MIQKAGRTVFTDFKENLSDILGLKTTKDSGKDDKLDLLVEACASCHACTFVDDELIGDPLEVKMFEMTDWILDENN
jgi:cation-transporting ATPase 13A2